MRTFLGILSLSVLLWTCPCLHADDGSWQELENWANSGVSSDTSSSSDVSASQLSEPSSTPAESVPSAPVPVVSKPVVPVVTTPGMSPSGLPVRPRRTPASLKAPAGFSHVPTIALNAAPVSAASGAVPAETPESSVSEPASALPAPPEPSAVELPPETAPESVLSEPPAPAAEVPPPAPVRRAAKPAAEAKKPEKNLFAEEFVLSPDQKLRYRTSDAGGYVIVESSGPGGKPAYAIVTDFGGSALRTRSLNGVADLNEAKKLLKENTAVETFQGAEIRKLTLQGADGQPSELFWVGHKSFRSREQAQAEITSVQAAVEAGGGNFGQMVQEAESYIKPEAPEPVHIQSPEDFEKEEKLVLKMLDALDVGEKNFGPFQGVAPGETVTWQSFGETTWRNTNLADHDFNDQVGYWTNRLVVKGINAPLNTIDPFVEFTGALQSDSADFSSTLKVYYGLEWRPLARNPWLYNFRPWSLPLLEWVRNYRFYVMYGDNYPLKDEIENSRDSDLIWGVQIFYEWGIDLPSATEGKPVSIPDYLREYVWGEYFGNYRWEKTNFGSEEDFNAFIWNSSVILGVRLPGIPLPPNPINDKLVLMPYMHFEHVNNAEFSFPYQNQYFVGAGVRWMPFRTYAYKENEWLSKVKVFGEYVGIGKTQHTKQDGEAPYAVRYDWRVGVAFSSRRF